MWADISETVHAVTNAYMYYIYKVIDDLLVTLWHLTLDGIKKGQIKVI